MMTISSVVNNSRVAVVREITAYVVPMILTDKKVYVDVASDILEGYRCLPQWKHGGARLDAECVTSVGRDGFTVNHWTNKRSTVVFLTDLTDYCASFTTARDCVSEVTTAWRSGNVTADCCYYVKVLFALRQLTVARTPISRC